MLPFAEQGLIRPVTNPIALKSENMIIKKLLVSAALPWLYGDSGSDGADSLALELRK